MVKKTNLLIHLLFIITSLLCLIPFFLVLMVSLTDQNTLIRDGYSFWPHKFDLSAYRYLVHDAQPIIQAYGVSILVTSIGVIISLMITSTLAYTISRYDFPFWRIISFYVFFTLLFNGGLLPWYLVYTRLLHLQDTLVVLIATGLLNGFNVLIMRTFFANSIPPSVLDSAKIDGANEYRIYYSIILPLSLPVMATIGLFVTIGYWNDWFTSLIFINNQKLYSLQYFLNKTLTSLLFLQDISSRQYASQALNAQPPPLESIRMAMAMLAIGPMVLVFPFLQKYFVKGLTVGAVKG